VKRGGIAIAVACLVGVGCSSSSPGTGGTGAGSDAGGGEAGTHPEGGTGGACTGPANNAPAIVATCDSSASQTPAGGTIVDGTYQATSDIVLHDTPCSSAYVPSTTLQIANGIFAFTFSPVPGTGAEQQQASYTVSGSNVVLTGLCDTDPNGVVGTASTIGYTASAGQLILFFPSCCDDSYLGENVTFSRM
jgi:hypothetical protein